jgi:polyribonucleotide nucleotidyltransferase
MVHVLQVVGWVIGRSGSHIKEMKHRTGCGMWVDQKDLKLYITGSDMPRIHHAAAMVGDLISKVRCVN